MADPDNSTASHILDELKYTSALNFSDEFLFSHLDDEFLGNINEFLDDNEDLSLAINSCFDNNLIDNLITFDSKNQMFDITSNNDTVVINSEIGNEIRIGDANPLSLDDLLNSSVDEEFEVVDPKLINTFSSSSEGSIGIHSTMNSETESENEINDLCVSVSNTQADKEMNNYIDTSSNFNINSILETPSLPSNNDNIDNYEVSSSVQPSMPLLFDTDICNTEISSSMESENDALPVSDNTLLMAYEFGNKLREITEANISVDFYCKSNKCIVEKCLSSTKNNDILIAITRRFVYFLQWCEILNLDLSKHKCYICKNHFEEKYWTKKSISNTAIPTLNMPFEMANIQSSPNDKNKHHYINRDLYNHCKSAVVKLKRLKPEDLSKYSKKVVSVNVKPKSSLQLSRPNSFHRKPMKNIEFTLNNFSTKFAGSSSVDFYDYKSEKSIYNKCIVGHCNSKRFQDNMVKLSAVFSNYKEWMRILQIPPNRLEHPVYICEKHFDKKYVMSNFSLHEEAIPTLDLVPGEDNEIETNENNDKYYNFSVINGMDSQNQISVTLQQKTQSNSYTFDEFKRDKLHEISGGIIKNRSSQNDLSVRNAVCVNKLQINDMVAVDYSATRVKSSTSMLSSNVEYKIQSVLSTPNSTIFKRDHDDCEVLSYKPNNEVAALRNVRQQSLSDNCIDFSLNNVEILKYTENNEKPVLKATANGKELRKVSLLRKPIILNQLLTSNLNKKSSLTINAELENYLKFKRPLNSSNDEDKDNNYDLEPGEIRPGSVTIVKSVSKSITDREKISDFSSTADAKILLQKTNPLQTASTQIISNKSNLLPVIKTYQDMKKIRPILSFNKNSIPSSTVTSSGNNRLYDHQKNVTTKSKYFPKSQPSTSKGQQTQMYGLTISSSKHNIGNAIATTKTNSFEIDSKSLKSPSLEFSTKTADVCITSPQKSENIVSSTNGEIAFIDNIKKRVGSQSESHIPTKIIITKPHFIPKQQNFDGEKQSQTSNTVSKLYNAILSRRNTTTKVSDAEETIIELPNPDMIQKLNLKIKEINHLPTAETIPPSRPQIDIEILNNITTQDIILNVPKPLNYETKQTTKDCIYPIEKCVVNKCSTSFPAQKRMYLFSTKFKHYKAWIDILKLSIDRIKYQIFVCEDHFEKWFLLRNGISINAIPTLNLDNTDAKLIIKEVIISE